MKETMPEPPQPYRCVRCQNGCIHLVCGHVMLALSEEQFRVLFDSASEIYHQLQTEMATTPIPQHLNQVVM